jgi:hypothetical protein
VPSSWRITSIALDDALILSHRAKPHGWNFRERQLIFLQISRLKLLGRLHCKRPFFLVEFRQHEHRTPTHGYAGTREAAMAAFAKSWRRE